MSSNNDIAVNFHHDREVVRYTPPPPPSSSTFNLSQPCKEKLFDSFIIALLLGLLVLIITLPLSFHTVSYNYFAFKRNVYGTVDTSEIYYPGRYFLPLNYEFVQFSSTYTAVQFFNSGGTGISVYSSTGLLFVIDIAFYYIIPPEKLGPLYTQYSDSFDDKIQTKAKAIIKDVASEYSFSAYIANKTAVESALAIAVKSGIEADIQVTVPIALFFLQDVAFPDTILQSALNSVLQVQNNELQQQIQQVSVVQQTTLTLLASLQAEASFISSLAAANAQQVTANAMSYSVRRSIQARNTGLAYVASQLGISSSSNVTRMNKFIKIMALYQTQNPTLVYGTNQNSVIMTATR